MPKMFLSGHGSLMSIPQCIQPRPHEFHEKVCVLHLLQSGAPGLLTGKNYSTGSSIPRPNSGPVSLPSLAELPLHHSSTTLPLDLQNALFTALAKRHSQAPMQTQGACFVLEGRVQPELMEPSTCLPPIAVEPPHGHVHKGWGV